MSESESKISNYSQTLSEPKEEEMGEENDDVQVIFSQIEPYQGKPVAKDDSTGKGTESTKKQMKMVLCLLYRKPDKKERFLLIHGSYNCCCIFQYKLLCCVKAKLPYTCLPLSWMWYHKDWQSG